MNKKLIIDMDDVICDGGFLYLVNKFLGTNYTIKDCKDYYIQGLIPENKTHEWVEFFKKNNMYEKAEFIGNAYEIIKKLNEKYDVYILTDYIMRDDPSISGILLKNKFEWLQKNIPFIPYKNYIFTTSKEIIKCDIRIDDKLSNLDGDADIKLLFTAYHNNLLTDEKLDSIKVKRVNNWSDIAEILL